MRRPRNRRRRDGLTAMGPQIARAYDLATTSAPAAEGVLGVLW